MNSKAIPAPDLEGVPYGNGTDERQRLDVYLPQCDAKALLLYLHGGGLEGGSREEARFLAGLAAQGIALILPGYRLYPTARYPDFILDAAAATGWAAAYRNSHYPGKKLYLAGSSAGAYLAMMLCFDEGYLAARGLRPDIFAGCLFDAGQPTVHFNVLREAGMPAQMVAVDERAPMYHVRAERCYPPMLFLCAEKDIPGRYEQTLLMISVLSQFGYGDRAEFRVMEGYAHCEYNETPVFRELIRNFIAAH
jgi:pimeloyl-ACP methyl ester carboxylesterase